MGLEDRTARAWQPESTQYVAPAVAGTLRAGMRILCVSEDLAYTEREVMPPLKSAGILLDVVPAEMAAVREKIEYTYQLILFDINSRHGQVYQICAHIRSRCSTPLMLVLHGAAREEVLRGFQSGADAYVIAPCDPRELLARLSGLLRREAAHTPCA